MTRADTEKRLAEAFFVGTECTSVSDAARGWIVGMCARIAAEEIEKAVLAEHLFGEREIKRLNDVDAQRLRMDAARKVRDWYEGEGADVLFQNPSDECLARIIGAEGHEGGDATVSEPISRTRDGSHVAVGEEVSGPSPQHSRDERTQAAEGSGITIGHPAQAAEPPRPDASRYFRPGTPEHEAYEWGFKDGRTQAPRFSDRPILTPRQLEAFKEKAHAEGLAEGRRQAFEEAAKIADNVGIFWYMDLAVLTAVAAAREIAAAIRAAALKGE